MADAESLKSIILPVLDQMGIDLVDLELHGSGNRTILRVFVDQEGGITLQRCANASRAIADILDRKDPIPSRYVLEVSSPGLNRPLTTERDFKRHVGKTVNIRYRKDDREERVEGAITQVSDSTVIIESNERPNEIKLTDIVLAKLVVQI